MTSIEAKDKVLADLERYVAKIALEIVSADRYKVLPEQAIREHVAMKMGKHSRPESLSILMKGELYHI